jgi:D-alanine-D-alanine ligase
VHGPYGEDGTLQGLLEQASLPYVGSGVLGSAVCMDKAMAKEVLASHGLPQVRSGAVRDVEFDADPVGLSASIGEELGFPLFVKPANLGSSIGVTRVLDRAGLPAAMRVAFSYDEWLVVEEEVRGREIECGLLGYPNLEASVVGEVCKSRDVYDYDDKYVLGAAELRVPAPLPPDLTEQIRSLALKVGAALRVDGMARVDFFLADDGRLLVNEVNTIPGFTPISMYPRLWEASGVPVETLIDRLVEAALDRFRHRAGRVGRAHTAVAEGMVRFPWQSEPSLP